jgi:hypothetical protein
VAPPIKPVGFREAQGKKGETISSEQLEEPVTAKELRLHPPRVTKQASNCSRVVDLTIGADNGHKLVIDGHGAVIEPSTTFTPFFRIVQIGPDADVTLYDLTIAHGLARRTLGKGRRRGSRNFGTVQRKRARSARLATLRNAF